ncbi:MAG: flagellar FlbD family protein [Terracidiphilus sp.]|nr:flagellar FlbD family protein [Terracidiphilus sp.]
MIELTRLNGTRIVLNSDLIKTCEASPDSMITLLNGEKLIVREDLPQIRQRMMAYRAQLLAQVVGQVQAVHTPEAELSHTAGLCEVANMAERSAANLLRGEG